MVVYDEGIQCLVEKEYERSLKGKVKIDFNKNGKLVKII